MARKAGTGFDYNGTDDTGENSPGENIIAAAPPKGSSRGQDSPWIAFLRSRSFQRGGAKIRKSGSFWQLDPETLDRFWQNQRLLWTGFAFAAGIVVYILLPGEPSWMVLGALLVLIGGIAFVHSSRSGLSNFSLLALAVFAGLSIASIRTAAVNAPRIFEPMTANLRGEVLELQHRQSGKRLLLKVGYVNGRANEGGLFAERVRLRVPDETDTRPGDWVMLRARLFPPMGPVVPGGYDFSFRAYFQKIGATGFSYGVPELIQGPAPTLYRQAGRQIQELRGYLATRISQELAGSEEAALAIALLVGDRSGIDEAAEESLRAAGLAHILAISGLHMALFAGGAYAVCLGALALLPGFALRWPLHKAAAVLALGAAIFYLVLSGASVATQRSFIMIALVFLGILTGRRGLTLRSAALAGIFLLLLAPERLFYPGFQMSFAAVIALIAVYDLWRGQRKDIGASSWPKTAASRLFKSVLKWSAGLFVTALVAGTATGIIGAYHFSRVAPFGIIGNMLGMPVFSLLVMPMGVLALVFMPFGVSAVPLKIMASGLAVLMEIASFTENIAPDIGRTGTLEAAPASLLVLALFAGLLAPGRMRILCLFPLVPALVLMVLSRPPDIQIAAAGSQLAARDSHGQLRLTLVRKSFAAETWLEGEGEVLEAIKSRKMTSRQRRCDQSGCVVLAYAPRGTDAAAMAPLKIAFPKSAEAIMEDCRKADIIVTDIIAPNKCRAGLILDQAVRGKSGAVSIWLAQPSFGEGGEPEELRSFEAQSADAGPFALKPNIGRINYAIRQPPRPWHRPGTVTRTSMRQAIPVSQLSKRKN